MFSLPFRVRKNRRLLLFKLHALLDSLAQQTQGRINLSPRSFDGDNPVIFLVAILIVREGADGDLGSGALADVADFVACAPENGSNVLVRDGIRFDDG